MQVELNKQEAWKLLDAIKAYKTDYHVTGPVKKTLEIVSKKIRKVIDG